jgi:GntR family transcriptional regulator
MSIDPTDPRPPYRQVADRLRDAIVAGDLAPGQALPSVRALAQQYDLTNVTATRAVDLLRSEGLVDTRLGRGTFVRTPKPVIRVGAYLTANSDGQRETWATEGNRHGFDATQEITEVATVPAPADVAERLGIPPDTPTVVRRRVLRADGVPVQLSDSYYPTDLAAGTELAQPAKLRGYTVAALGRLGIDVDRFHDELQMRMPSPHETRALRLGKGVPVVRLLRTTYAADGRPVEVADQLLAGDRHILSYDIPAHTQTRRPPTP